MRKWSYNGIDDYFEGIRNLILLVESVQFTLTQCSLEHRLVVV